MARKSAPEPAGPERVTLLNLKGSPEEKARLDDWNRKTGIPLSEITRRALASWGRKRGLTIPKGWVED